MTDSRISYLFGDKDYIYPCDEYLDYITPAEVFNIVVQQANIHFNLKKKVVWDMFSGIGTDSIRLAMLSGLVQCTELNVETYNCLKHNIELSGYNNIIAKNADCSSPVGYEPDIIYFDPPWGDTFKSGSTFTFEGVRLSNGTLITDLLMSMYNTHDMIIKSPYMSDSLDKLINPEDIISILTFSRQKLKYIFVRQRT